MTRETITLQYPVTVDGEEITELHIRRPKMADMKRGQKHKDDLEKSTHLIADLAEVTPRWSNSSTPPTLPPSAPRWGSLWAYRAPSIVAGWNIAKDALGAALDWISSRFSEAWAIISPVINGLKWVQDNGAAAMSSVTGANKGPISSGPYTGGATGPILPPAAVPGVTVPAVPARAQGGTFFPGALLVGERGPELRYESRSGFIAHHNALRGLVDLSQRARSLAGLVMAGGAGPDFAGAPMPVPVAAPAGQARQISHEPHYNLVINGSGLDAAQLRAAVRAELQAARRRAAADLRGLLHD